MRAISTKPDLVEQVHNLLIDAIVTGEYAPGQRITQEEIADRFGVSRQPVLQAIVLLRQQGLLRDGPGRRGIHVAALDAEFLINLYEVRAALDGAAAAAAARHDGASRRTKGMELIRKGREAVSQGDARQIAKADWEFHRFIYRAANNPLLLASARHHWHHTQRALSVCLAHAGSLRGVWSEHQKILEAVLKHDAKTAERLSRKHADKSLDLLLGMLDAEQDEDN